MTTATPPTPLRWGATLRRGVYLALALGVATMAALLAFGGGVSLVARAALSLSWVFVALALVGVALEWMVDAARFVVAGRAIGVRLPARVWLEVALVNLFAAYVASTIGPIPVAAYVMVRRGASAGDALAVTVGKHLLFFPSALGPAWLLLCLARDRVGGAALFATMTGLLILSMAMFAAMVAVAFWPAPAERLLRRLTFARHGQAVSDFVSAIARFFRGRADLLLNCIINGIGESSLHPGHRCRAARRLRRTGVDAVGAVALLSIFDVGANRPHARRRWYQ